MILSVKIGPEFASGFYLSINDKIIYFPRQFHLYTYTSSRFYDVTVDVTRKLFRVGMYSYSWRVSSRININKKDRKVSWTFLLSFNTQFTFYIQLVLITLFAHSNLRPHLRRYIIVKKNTRYITDRQTEWLPGLPVEAKKCEIFHTRGFEVTLFILCL